MIKARSRRYRADVDLSLKQQVEYRERELYFVAYKQKCKIAAMQNQILIFNLWIFIRGM